MTNGIRSWISCYEQWNCVEPSLFVPFASKEDADNGLLAFFTVLKVCRASGLKILLVDEDQDKSLMGLELANGYFVRDWFASANKVAELADWCRFLKSLETKQPLFETVDIESVGDTVGSWLAWGKFRSAGVISCVLF